MCRKTFPKIFDLEFCSPSPIRSLFKTDTGDKENRDFYWLAHGIEIGIRAYVYCADIEGDANKVKTDHWGKIDVKTMKVTGMVKLPNMGELTMITWL